MSYPLILQPLVIEDDEGTKEAYKNIFETIAGEFSYLPFAPAQPCFAFSYEEALECLNGSKMFHVVIVDLRLPEKPRLPPIEGIELGVNLLAHCIERDRFPIPCLLVISGHVGATEQARMQETLRQGFYYGRQFAKGSYELLKNEVSQACKEAIRYCSVGLHLRDGGNDQYPTITPREEDLLRRSVLGQQGASGLDLDWWSAKRFSGATTRIGGSDSTWTKVLMGRYLLDGGRGASRPKFFKLLPGSFAPSVIESARHVEHKLPHIKFTSSVASKRSALIVTEKVGSQQGRPKSLETFFKEANADQSFRVAEQVAKQVSQLGDILADSRELRTIFWGSHDKARLSDQWRRFDGTKILEKLGFKTDPIDLYSELADCRDKVRVNEQSLAHGDLHISNVALDFDTEGAEAYIFDAGVVSRDVAGRDLAVLEVSAILHVELEAAALSKLCSALYGLQVSTTDEAGNDSADPVVNNIVAFVRGLRKGGEALNGNDVYTLMVFDYALIQVGGLAFGSSGNKIREPRSALFLLAVVADWYQKLRAQSKGPQNGQVASASK